MHQGKSRAAFLLKVGGDFDIERIGNDQSGKWNGAISIFPMLRGVSDGDSDVTGCIALPVPNPHSEIHAMADFKLFFPTLLQHEGGFVNDPADPGGATNKGVTLGTFKGCAQRLLNIAPTLDALKALSDDQAGVIYKALYWDPIKGDQISLQPLANIVFDFQVNAGNRSAKLLQQVLNDLGTTPPLQVDGAIGNGTLAALRAIDQKAVYARFKQYRADYYRNLVAQRPALQKFLKGWLNRVDSFPDLAA